MAIPDSAEAQLEPDESELWDQISNAAEQGDLGELHTRLAQWKLHGFERRMIDAGLGHAVEAKHADAVRLLTEHGAKMDGDMISVAVDDAVPTDIWQALVDGGWDPNSLDESGHPVIFNFLSDPADQPTLLWFLSHGASAEAFSRRTGLTAISWAAGYQPVSALRALLEHSGVAGDDKLSHSNAVHEAASNKSEDRTAALALLVDEFGADVNVLSTYKSYGKAPPRHNRPECRPLHKAVYSGRREHVRFLLDRGARVTEKDAEDQDVRAYAEISHCSEGWRAVEEWFAEKGLEMPGEGQKGVGEGIAAHGGD